jgi:hypothetical protein
VIPIQRLASDHQENELNVRVGLCIASIITLVGCVSAGPVGSTGPAASVAPVASAIPSTSRSHVDVRLARAGGHVAILKDGTATLESGTRVDIVGRDQPAPVSEAMTASSDVDLVYVAVPDAHSVTAYTSGDGGGSWSTGQRHLVPDIEAVGDVGVAIVGDRLAVLLVEATSTAVSSGVVAIVANGNEKWILSPAPVGGTISSAGGGFWIVGGVMGDQVFASADGSTWRPVTIPASTKYWTAGTATTVDRVGVVIPVTSHDPGRPSDLSFLATSDQGKTWRSVASVSAPPTEFDTTIPTSITADGHWVAIWPNGSKVLAGTLGAKDQTIISPNGLPANIGAVEFSSATVGVAVGSVANCPQGKSSCTSTAVVTRTNDGGQDWTPMP